MLLLTFIVKGVPVSSWLKLKQLNRMKNTYLKGAKLKLKLKLFHFFYRNRSVLSPEDYKTVCIFMHTQAIGDAIVTSGFIKSLRDSGKKVYVIVPSRILFLFEEIIKVDGCYEFNKKTLKNIAQRLNKVQVDLIVDFFDFDHAVKYRLETLFFIKTKHAITFNHPEHTIFDTNIINIENIHITNRMIYVLNLLKIKNSNYRPQLLLNESKFPEPYDFSRKIKTRYNKLIIFNPFGSHSSRNLSQDQINKIIDYLGSNTDFYTIIFNMGKNIHLGTWDNVIYCPYLDAQKSFSLICSADLVITVDTAVVHLASAFDIRQYCIYNNRMHIGKYNNNIMWSPNNNNAIQLYTSEHLGTIEGDDISKFDTKLLFNAIDENEKIKGI